MSKIVVQRPSNMAPLGKYKIQVDGVEVGILCAGSEVTIDTTPGIHTLSFFYFGKAKKTVTINVPEEQETVIVVFKLLMNGGIDLLSPNIIGCNIVEKKKMGYLSQFLIGIAICVFLVVVMSVFISIKNRNTYSNETTVSNEAVSSDAGAASDPTLAPTKDLYKPNKVIYSNNSFKVTFMYLDDTLLESMKNLGIVLRIENFTDSHIVPGIENVYINDTNVVPLGGTWAGIEPHKNAVGVFNVTTKFLDITDITGVKKLEFNLFFTSSKGERTKSQKLKFTF